MSLATQLAAQDEALRLVGINALVRAVNVWGQGVMEPTRKSWGDPAYDDDRAFINLTIHSPTEGIGWPYARSLPLLKDFRWDGDFEWCGAFAAHAWHRVRPDLRFHYFASTYRLYRYARYQSPPNKLYRYEKAAPVGTVPRKYLTLPRTGPLVRAAQLKAFGLRAGDIAVVNGSDDYGQHIVVVRGEPDWKRLLLPCVEGNATGRGPSGERYQGVTQNDRPFDQIRHLYRPGFADLMEGT